MGIDLTSIQLTKVANGLHQGNSLIYGNPKVGKTTFAVNIPGYLLVATEKGYDYLNVYKQDISSWQDFLDLCAALVNQKHNYRTLVIDTTDWLYKYCEAYVNAKHQVTHASDLGFGKGFSFIRDEFSRVINKLNQSGFNFVFITHAKEKTMKTKTGEWTVMGTSLSGSPETFIAGLCNHIFYFYIDDNGNHLMRTKPTKYILAGDRSALLPEIMPIDYSLVNDYLTGTKVLSSEQKTALEKRQEINAQEKVSEVFKQEEMAKTEQKKIRNYAPGATN